MPQIRVRNAVGAIQTVKQISMRDATNVLRSIQRIRMRDAGNVLRTVFTGMQVSANTPVSGTSAASPVTSSASTVTVTGGTAPYTYVWRAYQNDTPLYNPDSIVIVTPTANSTTFRKTMPTPDLISGTFECEVTDALGTVRVTNPVAVTLQKT